MERSYEQAGETYELTKNLYVGKAAGYTRCKECGYESKRPEEFQDIQLPIKNEFGTGVVNSSLEMAVENYLKPDLLEGDNQYMCEPCGKKVDAEKGQMLERCPEVLTMSLNRFALDYSTF